MKKVLLVLPQFFYKQNNTGITLQNIFKLYDFDCLAEVSFEHDSNTSRLQHSFCFPTRRKRNHLLNLMYILKTTHSKDFNVFVSEFKPDVCYCICTTFQTAITCLFIKRKYKIPVIVHHFDNARETSKFLLLHKYLYKKIEKSMKCGLVISDYMKFYYEKKYNCEYEVLMNSVMKRPFLHANVFNCNRFLYVGGLHLRRLESIMEIAKIIENMNRSNDGTKSQFDIYTPDVELCSDATIPNNRYFEMHAHSPINNSEILNLYQQYDVLVHVESFDMSIFPFLKYSISTKIPEYLMSGKVILCYAPSDSAVFKFIKDNKLGYAVSTKKELLEAIENINKNQELNSLYVNNAYKMACERFTCEKAFETLNRVIDLNLKNIHSD